MALLCQNCEAEIPEAAFGPEEAVEENLTEEVVAHTFDPEDSLAVSETAYYCDPGCFVEGHAGNTTPRNDSSTGGDAE